MNWIALIALACVCAYVYVVPNVNGRLASIYRDFYSDGRTVYIVPTYVSEGDLGQTGDNPSIELAGIEWLRSCGYRVKFTSFQHIPLDADYVVFYNANLTRRVNRNLKYFPKERLTLVVFEPPAVIPAGCDPEYHKQFSRVYTWDDDLVDGDLYRKLTYHHPMQMIERPVPFSERKLCAIVAGNKKSRHPYELYSERVRIIRFFEQNHPHDFDLYGKVWKREEYSSSRGAVDDKRKTLSHYRFNIAYENTRGVRGYLTEKIWDAFVAGCIPVYWGASNVTDYIPADCFIDGSQFGSFEEMYLYLSEMSEDTFEAYLGRIARFVERSKNGPFSIDYNISQRKEMFQELVGSRSR